MCCAPAAPAPPFLAPRAALASAPPIPTPCWPSTRLASPLCHPPELRSAAARHRCSPTSASSYSWQPPRVAPRSTATLVLPVVFSRTRHAVPATGRAPPAAAPHAAGRQHQLSLAVPSPQLEAHPRAPNALPLMFPHPHSHCHFLSRPPHHTGPPPQPLVAVVSRPRRFPSPIQYTNSISVTH
jgi:hypothetical protein